MTRHCALPLPPPEKVRLQRTSWSRARSWSDGRPVVVTMSSVRAAGRWTAPAGERMLRPARCPSRRGACASGDDLRLCRQGPVGPHDEGDNRARPWATSFLGSSYRCCPEARTTPSVWAERLPPVRARNPAGNEFDQITAPVLLIWGDADGLVDRPMQEHLVGRIPYGTLIVYPGVGHTPRWEAPSRFAADVAAFVERSMSARL